MYPSYRYRTVVQASACLFDSRNRTTIACKVAMSGMVGKQRYDVKGTTFEVDEHDDGPANPEDREEILQKIMRSLHDGTQQYAPCPEFQAILDEQYGPAVLPDDMETVPAAVVDAAGADADADSSSTALDPAASFSADQSNRPDPAQPPPGEFFLAKLGPDMVRAVCTHLALTIQGGPQLKRLQATCRGMRDALAADEPEIHELW